LRVSDTTAILKNVVDSVYCSNETAVSLASFISPAGGTFSGSGVSGINFNPGAAVVGANMVTYQFSNSYGCTSSLSFNLNVAVPDVVSLNVIDTVFCNNEAAVSLAAYASPTGGIFSGNGVSGNNFDPSVASIGWNSILYNYTNGWGCLSSDSFQLLVTNCTGIKEPEEELGFSIFPNPSNGRFTIKVNSYSVRKIDMVVTDAIGKICFQNTFTISPNNPYIATGLSTLPKGVYSIQLIGEKDYGHRSIIIE
jgi:hypothetical protein